VDAPERREQHAEHGTGRDEEQPDDDAGVRRREERLVAAVGDVPGHVGVEALAGDDEAEHRRADGGRRPAGDAGDPLEAVWHALEARAYARALVARASQDD